MWLALVDQQKGNNRNEKMRNLAALTNGSFDQIKNRYYRYAKNPAAEQNAQFIARKFADPEFWATRDAERVFNVIQNGAAAVGGSLLMVGWAFMYDDEEIRALTDYVMAFGPGGQ